MVFEFNLQSSFLLIFFVHIMVYAFMQWRRGYRTESISDKLLGSFLFFAALSVVPWMTGFAGWYDPLNPVYKDILFYTPFVHGLFFGPLLFLYVKTITNFNYRLQKKDWLHFLPGVLYFVWCIVVVLVDKLILHKYFLMNGENDPDFADWYVSLQKISILFYLILSVHYYKQYRKYVAYEMSFAEAAGFSWLRNFLIAFGIITILPIIELVLSQFTFFQKLRYYGGWYYFFLFGLVVYYIAINGYNAISIPLRKLLFQPELLLQYQNSKALLPAPTLPAIEDIEHEVVDTQTNEDENLKAWKTKIMNAMQTEKCYEDAELTLTQLAKKLSTNTSVLSKVVNQGFGANFNDFVNSFRVNAVIDMLKKGEQKTQTLLGISFDCGFNSKATFNRAFKKQTGFSPKEWMEKNEIA
jgi:AraC-like DNA-binding protein